MDRQTTELLGLLAGWMLLGQEVLDRLGRGPRTCRCSSRPWTARRPSPWPSGYAPARH